MLFTVIGILSVVLGFCLAIHVMFEKMSSKVSAWSIFVTAAMGTMFSIITGTVMLFVIWPPVNVVSWLVFAAFATGIAGIVVTNNKGKEGRANVDAIDSSGPDLRSGTGG